MRQIKKSTIFLFAFLLLFLFLILTTHQFEVGSFKGGMELPGSSLTNLHSVDTDVYRSDQPSSVDFKALEQLGIKEVLNLRNFFTDDKKASETSLVLHHLPMHAHTVSETKLIEALRIIKNRKGPILIHCFHGADRTGAVVAMYRMVMQGVPKEEAIREMKQGGYGHHNIFFNITRTLENIDVEKVRAELDQM